MVFDFSSSQLSSLELIAARPSGLIAVSAELSTAHSLSSMLSAPLTKQHDVDAILSGTKSIWSVPAASAFSLLPLLNRRGIPRDILSSVDFLAGLIHQTQIPALCQHCKLPYIESQNTLNLNVRTRLNETAQHYSQDISGVFIRCETGCEHCANTGYSGELSVAEIVAPDDVMKSHISRAEDIEVRRHWINNGGQTALARAIELAFSGLVDPRDVERKYGLLTADLIMNDGVFDIQNESKLTRSPMCFMDIDTEIMTLEV